MTAARRSQHAAFGTKGTERALIFCTAVATSEVDPIAALGALGAPSDADAIEPRHAINSATRRQAIQVSNTLDPKKIER